MGLHMLQKWTITAFNLGAVQGFQLAVTSVRMALGGGRGGGEGWSHTSARRPWLGRAAVAMCGPTAPRGHRSGLTSLGGHRSLSSLLPPPHQSQGSGGQKLTICPRGEGRPGGAELP